MSAITACPAGDISQLVSPLCDSINCLSLSMLDEPEPDPDELDEFPPGSDGAPPVTALVAEELISLAATTAPMNEPKSVVFEVCPLAVICSWGMLAGMGI